MESMNITTTVTEFVLLGLTQNYKLQYCLFVTFFLIYVITWLLNFTIIATVAVDHQLHTPMYFLLANLAFLDVSDSSVNTPRLLSGLLTQHTIISFNQCFLQMFFFHFIAGAMSFLLLGMTVDRYVAICEPLRYLSIMNWNTCTALVAAAWLGGFLHSITQTGFLLQLPFCGPNVLDNFYCDVPQVIKLACTGTRSAELQMVFNSGLILISLFVILIISYVVILLKIRTCITEGKRKALSTCGTQITVVSLIFIPCIFTYAQIYKKYPMDKVASIVYTVVTPMLNPMIYTLRNTEMKKAIRRTLGKIFLSAGIQKPEQTVDPKTSNLVFP
ncbi:olfactory receptor 4D1-like [Vidua chalybeata]|uniref:olfactory receptor 4D1-like n=1 Tax=Vidua chalybeata TaxID=81927 RepID=UPI0023A7F053|nr:olfactory receptor 4D1-like [Vidua chalybeata]